MIDNTQEVDNYRVLQIKSLKKSSNIISVGFISFHILILALTILIKYVLNNFNFQLENFTNKQIILYFLSCLLTVISLLPFIFVYKKLNCKPKEIFVFNKINFKYFIAIYFFGILICILSNFFVGILSEICNYFGFSLGHSDLPSANNIFDTILLIICVSLMPALIEELIFRGIILGSLLKYGNLFAVIVSSALFCFSHSTLVQLPFAFILGFTFGFIRIKTNSLFIPIALHFTNNLISLLSSFSTSTQNIIFIITILFVFFGIISVFLLKFKTNFFHHTKYSVISTCTKTNLKNFFLTIGMIISMLIVLTNIFNMVVDGL